MNVPQCNPSPAGRKRTLAVARGLSGAENGAGGGGEQFEAVIDSGFDGELTLPEERIRRLGYPYSGSAGGTLADGSEGHDLEHSPTYLSRKVRQIPYLG